MIKEYPIIQSIKYNGIKSNNLLENLTKDNLIKEKSPYNENLLNFEINRLQRVIKEFGYYNSSLEASLVNLDNNLVSLNFNIVLGDKAKIKKITPEYKNSSGLFHSKAEVEDLYLSLSRFAAVNGLVIKKKKKKEPKPVLKSGKVKQANLNLKDVSYYKIPVEYEITGNFLGYIKFKRDISKSKKMLNFDKETISIVQQSTTGAIIARGNLTIVGLPNEFF